MRQFNENGVVHVDCQRSAMNAFRRTFGCKVKVCLFHINQALWRFVSSVGLATAYNNTNKPRLHSWVRRLMAFPFMKAEKMTACFHDCFEVMAFDDIVGVEAEFCEQFKKVVAYYKRFWLDGIGPETISHFNAENRTNNHAEAFHRGIGCAVQVAHPQTLVLIQLLVNIERDSMLRFNDQRAGKSVKWKDKRLDELEHGLASMMNSYENGLYSTDSQYLGEMAKLYVEYNHRIKTARFRNNTALIRRVDKVRDVVVKTLEDQNNIVVGEDPSTRDAPEEPVFTDVDFNSEIMFDAVTAAEGREHGEKQIEINDESEVAMEICSEESVSEKRCHETKPRENDLKGKSARRRRRTLIQRMKKKR